MIYETLYDHLSLAGISKKEACKLFGKTPRTLKRWNEDPPQWVLNIVRMIGEYKVMPSQWSGWYFDRQWIVDPAGNAYHHNDVSNLWIERQITKSVRGDCMTIHSLKNELEKRIQAFSSELSITVNLGEMKKEFRVAL